MKTTVHIFTDYNALKPKIRALALPKLVIIDITMFETIAPFDGKIINLDNETIYIDRWVSNDLQMIIPDFARVQNSKKGFYLEQSEIMMNTRDATHQCSYCNIQIVNPPDSMPFCPECITNHDIPDDQLHKLFLRPVSTFDIELSPQSVYIPEYIKQRRTRTPELFNDVMINI